MKRIWVLVKSDLKSIRRDGFLLIIAFVPILILLVFKFGIPELAKLIAPFFSLKDYYEVFTVFMIVLTPMMYGIAVGFLLLDDRDEQILAAVSVTPIQKSGYLTYKIAFSIAVSLLFGLTLPLILGLSQLDFIVLLPVALMSSLEAPIFALAVASFSGNKVEGLAFTKFLSVFDMVPVIPFIVKNGWEYCAGVIPTFWPAKALLDAKTGGWLFAFDLTAGFAMHIALLWLLLHIFRRRIG